MRSEEFSGRNIEQAISAGLKALGKNQEDVDIAVISEGGIFSKAKVIISFEDEEENVAEIIENKIKSEIQHIERVFEKQESFVEEQIEKVEKQVEKIIDDVDSDGVKFIEEMLAILNIDAEIKVEMIDDCKKISINGESAGKLIGYRGEGLNAIQILANTIEQRKNHDCHIILDIEKYKYRREQSLSSLANRLAEKAIATGRSQKLEPMNAYERRVIHTYLQDNDKIKTYSKGEEPRRYLIIEPIK